MNNSKGPIKCMAYLVKLQDACQAAVAGHRVPVAPAQHQLALLDCLQPSSGAVGMCDCIYTYEHLQLVACHFWAGCMWPSRSWLPRCGIMPASNGPQNSCLNGSADSYASCDISSTSHSGDAVALAQDNSQECPTALCCPWGCTVPWGAHQLPALVWGFCMCQHRSRHCRQRRSPDC